MLIRIHGKDSQRNEDIKFLIQEGLKRENSFKQDFYMDGPTMVITIEPQRPSFFTVYIDTDSHVNIKENLFELPISPKTIQLLMEEKKVSWI